MKIINQLLKLFHLKHIKSSKQRKMRMCCLCGAQIKRAERWHYSQTHEPQHWHCDNPTRGPEPLQDAEPVNLNLYAYKSTSTYPGIQPENNNTTRGTP